MTSLFGGQLVTGESGFNGFDRDIAIKLKLKPADRETLAWINLASGLRSFQMLECLQTKLMGISLGVIVLGCIQAGKSEKPLLFFRTDSPRRKNWLQSLFRRLIDPDL